MREVNLAGRTLRRAAHVCVFSNSQAEKYRALLPFIKDGIEGGDKAFHMLDPPRSSTTSAA